MTQPLNIVFIMMDDMGYGDMECYGATPLNTPVMNRIAQEGIRCTRMYGAPTCSPSRAQVLTGQYAQRVGVPRVIFSEDDWGLEPPHRTVASHLKDCGYATAAFGKWHLGEREAHRPTRHGFDTYYGPIVAPSQPEVTMWRDEQETDETVSCGATTRRFFEEAFHFIDTNKDNPFFIYLTPTMPHVPIGAEPPFLGRSRAGLYGDAIETIDHYVGCLLDKLQQHGLSDNTVVIVTSDNGPWYQGRTDGARGRKFETYEGGVRVPFIARGPGIQPGTETTEPLHLMDMLPTFVRWADGTPPDNIAGLDIGPVLTGQTAQSPHDYIYLYHVYSLNAVIQGRWKLNLNQQRGEYPREGEFPHLIDLEMDPWEAYSVADRHTELTKELAEKARIFEAAMKPYYDEKRGRR